MLVRTRRDALEGAMFPLVAGFVILLAGLWMTATHIPLVHQARRGGSEVTNLDAGWHPVPGLVVLVLGLLWTVAWWPASAEEDRP